MKGFMYILECANGLYYIGSTIDLKKRIGEHQRGEGANFTTKNLPAKLVYFEEFNRIDLAFKRENKYRDGAEKKRNH